MVLPLATHGILLLAPLTISLGAALGVWPLDPRPEVTERFAPPESRYGAGHRGVDLAGSPGQQVRAAVAGTVSYAGSLAGRGVVVVAHGATRTTYEPVDATVRVGDEVSAGSPLGTLQLFASHCWPAACLHWGLLQGETYLDPLSLVGGGPVRLLPLAGGRMTGPGTSAAGPSAVVSRGPAHVRLPGRASVELG